MKINDLNKISTELLKECPAHDMGLPYSCVCPPAELDWRPIVLDLVTEIEELRKAWHETGEQRETFRKAWLEAKADVQRLLEREEPEPTPIEARVAKLEARLQSVLDANNLWERAK